MRLDFATGLSLATLMAVPVVVQAQSIDELFRQGNAAQAAGDYATAEAIWRQVLQQDPDNDSAYNNLGAVLDSQGRHTEAEAIFREALRLNPNFAVAYYNLGNVLDSQGRYEEAEAAYREALRLDPNFVFAYSNLGNVLYDQGRLAEAEAAYRNAIRLNPNDVVAYNNLGITLADQDRLAEAEIALREALRLDPSYANAYSSLGATLFEQGLYEAAEIAHREALRLDPNDTFSHFKLGNALYEQGRYEEAEAAYRTALRLDPNYALAYNNLGMVLADQGYLADAEDAFRAALRLKPDDAFAHNNLGTVLDEQGRYAEAEAAYREALHLTPDYALAYSNLGSLYQELKRYEEAIAQYEQALALDPNFTLAQNNLAETLRLLSLQDNPLPSRQDDLTWLPENEPLLPLLRAVVRVVTPTPAGIQYGTGWVVKREGNRIWVLTNRHVVTNPGPSAAFSNSSSPNESRRSSQAAPLATGIEVDFFSRPPEGRSELRLPAEIVTATGPHDDLDLALLLVEDAPDDIQPLAIASKAVSLDEDVRIIGHHNTPWSLARGYTSSLVEATTLELAGAAIGVRSSGSPILNSQNEVVGIITSISPPNVLNGRDFLGGFSYGHPSDALIEILTLWRML